MIDRMTGKMARTSRENGAIAVVAPRRDLCLDFANTFAWQDGMAVDSLSGPVELLRWCKEHGAVDAATFARLDYWSTGSAAESAAMFADAVMLRGSLYRVFFALAHRETPAARDVAALNSALAGAPMRHTLIAVDDGFGWRLEADRRPAASLLAPVLWSAGDLLVSPEVARIRHCANEKCLWLFLDDSKNGSRRWCSMQLCGNRAKAHRHYLRGKAP
jgi:predicted RNA-binding Zn ribbon-like protein